LPSNPYPACRIRISACKNKKKLIDKISFAVFIVTRGSVSKVISGAFHSFCNIDARTVNIFYAPVRFLLSRIDAIFDLHFRRVNNTFSGTLNMNSHCRQKQYFKKSKNGTTKKNTFLVSGDDRMHEYLRNRAGRGNLH
jgi:hypothetical protein